MNFDAFGLHERAYRNSLYRYAPRLVKQIEKDIGIKLAKEGFNSRVRCLQNIALHHRQEPSLLVCYKMNATNFQIVAVSTRLCAKKYMQQMKALLTFKHYDSRDLKAFFEVLPPSYQAEPRLAFQQQQQERTNEL